MPKKKPKPKTDSLTFEAALEQLKTIVGELEAGNLTLSDSLEKYEQGVKHLKRCQLALESAEKKIELLVDLDEDGNLITEPFDDAATNRPNRQTARPKSYTGPKKTVNQAEDEEQEYEVGDELEDDDDFDSTALF